MIVMDDSEHMHSFVSDDTLRIVALFIDREAYDRLLYGGPKHARLIPLDHNRD